MGNGQGCEPKCEHRAPRRKRAPKRPASFARVKDHPSRRAYNVQTTLGAVTMTHAARTPPLALTDVEAAGAILRSDGSRFSLPRRLVLERLFAADGPVSAEFLARGEGEGPPIELTSVYRSLERFEQLGIARHMHVRNGPGLYTLATPPREYLACERCNEVLGVTPGDLDAVRELIQRTFGYDASFSHFPIIGLCPRCIAQDAQRPDGPDHLPRGARQD
jgi:Fur family transcriptional regulator, ferric uptake regulator